jgi:hypothetical protein
MFRDKQNLCEGGAEALNKPKVFLNKKGCGERSLFLAAPVSEIVF